MTQLISEENIKNERKIQNQINESIKDFKCFYFDAGAGAGKTYSLQKSIEYILENRTDELLSVKQKILCITYTNAAKNEILERIGQNSLVVVSTIHEFLWGFIAHQQPLLINEHKKKIEEELGKIDDTLSEIKFYNECDDQESFKQIVLNQEFLDLFYQYYSESATDFRDAIKNTGKIDEKLLSNVSNFKKVVSALRSEQKLEEALSNSNKRKCKVRYNPTRNRDNLSLFIISHDTLLDYAYSIIINNNIVKRLFFDKYPYVLIDEYQDTDRKVVEIFNSILDYSRERETNFLIGYFGDYMQNIYDKGVGKLDTIVEDFIPIKKVFNRRSSSQIVELIERIRNDGFGQKSIYKNFKDGKIQFYHSSLELESLSSFLSQKEIDKDCAVLLLKNDKIAKEREFENLLNKIREFPRFSGGNYNNVGSEFLSNNLQNMGWFLREVLNFIDFIAKVKNEDSTVRMVTNFIEGSTQITYDVFIQFIKKVNSIKSTKIGGYINELGKISISNNKETNTNFEVESILKNIFSIDSTNNYIEQIKKRAYDYFYFTSSDTFEDDDSNESERDMSIINSFFDLELKEFLCWYEYVQTDKKETGINYYTLHGSKGLEFDNVVIVLENTFANKKDYIQFFFENYGNLNFTEEESLRFNSVRNLLYVACSRARKKLYIIYISEDLQQNERQNISVIFEEIKSLDPDILDIAYDNPES
ncbi:ATP-dependent helicase [Enterococcus ureilyticus]|uniref:UvrD-helicase domain-containing protein n=1 Tax=Enterococcus ureilyticus TaxID=1131292 RepID=UPI001A91E1A0|nr:UvrD-helicase domain-containing protein [Enterococcus ureilyticus]MBO0446894.1 ATP-dependent helicase [Enterococcus ureilyticus]